MSARPSSELLLPSRPGPTGAAPPGRPEFDTRMLHSLQAVRRLQHPSGEILSYRRDAAGNYVYYRSPMLSALVHDALGCFDPTSPWWFDGALELVPAQARRRFARSVMAVRRRIRGFLIWQQEAAGWWRFFGRGSGIDPDVTTTALAATALLESYGSQSLSRWEHQLAVVQSFRAPSGRYHTFQRPGHGGYGWMDDAGRPVVGFDRVVNAAVLGWLAATGEANRPHARQLAGQLLDEAAGGDLQNGTALYPNPLSFTYHLSRAWAQGDLPERRRLADALVPALLRRQEKAGDFGGPLSTAMAATALLELGYGGPERQRARQAVLRGMRPRGGWPYEDVVIHGFGSPAWTTALSMAFLARDTQLAGRAGP
jgi:hypothetical protein